MSFLKAFAKKQKNIWVFESLGQLRYLSCLSNVDGVIGNSSSGLTEAPSFKIGTINIGDRQTGRLKADSVISCEATAKSIRSALAKLYSTAFQASLTNVRNPYGDGQAVEAIVEILSKYPLNNILKKPFYDIHSKKTR